jgi:hypothetical protein
MRNLTERVYFVLCLALGRVLRSARYSKVRIVGGQHGELRVHKHRVFYAPLLVSLGGWLLRMLDSGVRVLPQRDWEERERHVHHTLRGTAIQIESDGRLVLPCLAGETLASVLDNPARDEDIRRQAIRHAVVALTAFHRLGLTHADATAENVIVDLEASVANWFDFETVHEAHRPVIWRRADDLRALLVTCLIRTPPEQRAPILQLILDTYADEGITRVLATSFTFAMCRPLTLHLAQAALSFRSFREIARLLQQRVADRQSSETSLYLTG